MANPYFPEFTSNEVNSDNPFGRDFSSTFSSTPFHHLVDNSNIDHLASTPSVSSNMNLEVFPAYINSNSGFWSVNNDQSSSETFNEDSKPLPSDEGSNLHIQSPEKSEISSPYSSFGSPPSSPPSASSSDETLVPKISSPELTTAISSAPIFVQHHSSKSKIGVQTALDDLPPPQSTILFASRSWVPYKTHDWFYLYYSLLSVNNPKFTSLAKSALENIDKIEFKSNIERICTFREKNSPCQRRLDHSCCMKYSLKHSEPVITLVRSSFPLQKSQKSKQKLKSSLKTPAWHFYFNQTYQSRFPNSNLQKIYFTIHKSADDHGKLLKPNTQNLKGAKPWRNPYFASEESETHKISNLYAFFKSEKHFCLGYYSFDSSTHQKLALCLLVFLKPNLQVFSPQIKMSNFSQRASTKIAQLAHDLMDLDSTSSGHKVRSFHYLVGNPFSSNSKSLQQSTPDSLSVDSSDRILGSSNKSRVRRSRDMDEPLAESQNNPFSSRYKLSLTRIDPILGPVTETPIDFRNFVTISFHHQDNILLVEVDFFELLPRPIDLFYFGTEYALFRGSFVSHDNQKNRSMYQISNVPQKHIKHLVARLVSNEIVSPDSSLPSTNKSNSNNNLYWMYSVSDFRWMPHKKVKYNRSSSLSISPSPCPDND